jgi:hypothetical protein
MKRKNIDKAGGLHRRLKTHERFLEEIENKSKISLIVTGSRGDLLSIELNSGDARDFIVGLMKDLERELTELGVEL